MEPIPTWTKNYRFVIDDSKDRCACCGTVGTTIYCRHCGKEYCGQLCGYLDSSISCVTQNLLSKAKRFIWYRDYSSLE